MAKLTWDAPTEKTYETGLDRGVLYLQDGTAVVWNGLTAVTESSSRSTTPLYFDGKKIKDVVNLDEPKSKLKAFTYPDEFLDLEGYSEYVEGFSIAQQRNKKFSLSYRTRVGDGTTNDPIGYKIHILYDLIAIPSDKPYTTTKASTDLVEFEWDLIGTAKKIPGYAPTNTIVADTRTLDSTVVSWLEDKLYGTVGSDPDLPTIEEVMAQICLAYTLDVVDNGNGTFDITGTSLLGLTATSTEFTINNPNAVYVTETVFSVSDP